MPCGVFVVLDLVTFAPGHMGRVSGKPSVSVPSIGAPTAATVASTVTVLGSGVSCSSTALFTEQPESTITAAAAKAVAAM